MSKVKGKRMKSIHPYSFQGGVLVATGWPARCTTKGENRGRPLYNQGVRMKNIHPCWFSGGVSLGEDIVCP